MPAKPELYATVTERQTILAWGRRLGCHSCGNK
jgi:hypothetical protein